MISAVLQGGGHLVELIEASVISILETTATDGKNYQIRFHNLDAIIAVGYRVNSFLRTRERSARWRRNSKPRGI